MSDQTKLDALTVTHRLQIIAALEQIALGPMVSDRDELTLRNAVRLMRNDLDAVEAINALEFLAREGYGPSFTQRAVMVGARAAMGTGDDSTSFRAACRALAYTTSREYAAAAITVAAKGRACPACGYGGAVPHVPGCVMTLLPPEGVCAPLPTPAPGGACPSCSEGRPGAAHQPGCNMIAPLPATLVQRPVPCAPRADNVPAVVEFNSRAKKWKWVKIVGFNHVNWEFFITSQISERIEFPAGWLNFPEKRAIIAAELRRIRAKRIF